ncbi:hypothetical protein L9F63_007945, partial [Diploptera punctata]
YRGRLNFYFMNFPVLLGFMISSVSSFISIEVQFNKLWSNMLHKVTYEGAYFIGPFLSNPFMIKNFLNEESEAVEHFSLSIHP